MKKDKDMTKEEKKILEQEAEEKLADDNARTTTDEEAAESKTQEEETNPLEEAQEEIADLKDKYLRLSAEFDNYRKRTMREKAELRLTAAEGVLTDLLPVVDDLERAIDNMKKNEELEPALEGVELIFHKLMKTLGDNGLKAIETEGKKFDTDYHEAIALLPGKKEDKDMIMDCVQKGYILNEKVIRHSKVAVGK